MRLSTFEAYYKQRAVSGSQQRSQQATLETTQGPHASLREARGIDFIRRARSTHGTAHLVRITSRADLRAAARAMALLASCSRREALGLEAGAALPRPQLPGRAPRPPGGGGPLLPEGLGPEAPERGHPWRWHRNPHPGAPVPGGHRLDERRPEERQLIAIPRHRGGSPALLVRVGVLVVAEGEQL